MSVSSSMGCKTEAYDQLEWLEEVIAKRVDPGLCPGQRIYWVIPTLYDRRRRLDREAVEIVEDRIPGRVTHPVREAVADAYTLGLPASVYAPSSDVANDYDYRTAVGQIIADQDHKQGQPVLKTEQVDQAEQTDKVDSNEHGQAQKPERAERGRDHTRRTDVAGSRAGGGSHHQGDPDASR